MSFPFPLPSRLCFLLMPLVLASVIPGAAHADEAGDIARLAQAGRSDEALKRIDVLLARQPADIQARFMKGVMLSETRPAEAIAIFTRLTQDYPRLPEPYNNLAVLHAAAGHYDKAKAALDRALRTNPAYATAFDNLGDVHARLASQAYDRALQIPPGKPPAGTQLALVRSISTPGALTAGLAVAPVAAAAATAPAAGPAPAPPATPPAATLAAAAPPARPERQAVLAQDAAPARAETARRPAVDPVPVRLVKVDKPDPKAKAAADAAAEKEAVLNAVQSWARAWSARDVQAYLSHYASDFDPAGGLSRKAWTEERHERIAGKGRIKVDVDKPQVTTEGNSATVRFRQVYVSDRLSATSRKTLELERQRGKWLIKQERTG
jgi:tetratricopeptide (TPR) repeat protein